MPVEILRCANEHTHGVCFRLEQAQLEWSSFFGISCCAGGGVPECRGLFYLDSDAGRFEGGKWKTVRARSRGGRLQLLQQAGVFRLHLSFTADARTGVVAWKTSLENTDAQMHVLYACLPRIPLQGGGFGLYGQYSAWCAENQGGWTDIRAGGLTLGNSAGRSTEGCTPFACIRQSGTGMAAAVYVNPIGDWLIRARHVAGHRSSATVLEAGLSDASLRLEIAAGETLELPELLFCGFSGEAEACCEPFERYLLARYPREALPGLVYNTWFFDFDVLDVQRLRRQVLAARELGCGTFVVDAGWFGKGPDWENQVGCWDECREQAFRGRMREFSDYVRAQGMSFGLWMEPERACPDTPVFRAHPDWFLKADAVIFDLTQSRVVDYLAEQVARLVRTYALRWMKLDYNTNMLRSLTGDNFYRYYQGERRFLERIRRENPDCSFEGCSSGGLRTDFDNVMARYHGHFVSDTVNPLEVLRMRQNTAPRLLPPFLGSWLVLQEAPFAIGTYTNHNRAERTKVFSAGDAWWEYTVDVSAEFALAVNLLGEWGISGDLTGLSEKTRASIRKAAAFYEAHRAFLARAVCHPLTALRPVNDCRGWAALQYENVDELGSVVFVFRLVDDAETLMIYPRNLAPRQRYRVLLGGGETGVRTGAELRRDGVAVTCPGRYEARILELIPAQADQNNDKGKSK